MRREFEDFWVITGFSGGWKGGDYSLRQRCTENELPINCLWRGGEGFLKILQKLKGD